MNWFRCGLLGELAQAVQAAFAAGVVAVAIGLADGIGFHVGDDAQAVFTDFTLGAVAARGAGGLAGALDAKVSGFTVCVPTAVRPTARFADQTVAVLTFGAVRVRVAQAGAAAFEAELARIAVGVNLTRIVDLAAAFEAQFALGAVGVRAALVRAAFDALVVLADQSFCTVAVFEADHHTVPLQADLTLCAVGVLPAVLIWQKGAVPINAALAGRAVSIHLAAGVRVWIGIAVAVASRVAYLVTRAETGIVVAAFVAPGAILRDAIAVPWAVWRTVITDAPVAVTT